MNSICALILFPLIAAIFIFTAKNDKIRNGTVKISTFVIIALTVYVFAEYFQSGISFSPAYAGDIDRGIMAAEILIAVYLTLTGIKSRKYIISFFAVLQVSLIVWFKFSQPYKIPIDSSLTFDMLTAIMVLIVGIIGSLICLYALGYMEKYHKRHKDYVPRKNFFFAVLFLFLSAMFGLVFSNHLLWLYFCWEITTLCSYWLIGYTGTEEARNNSLLALEINLGGGAALAAGIVWIGMNFHILELNEFVAAGGTDAALIPALLLSLAALTKSAQYPFCSWLLGAMVAPTPSSALLHSSTMVKAGVYLIIRISPLLGLSTVGTMVTTIGCITFLVCSIIAVTQTDGKKILAYSTIANLGLIIICAGVGTQESVWAAILLVIFHAAAKSLLFLSVGSIENHTGSRDVENMDHLLYRSQRLAIYMIIGIAGMFLAPFGMLISKWIALKAFIDSNHILAVAVIAYGSAITLFYWAKLIGKLITGARREDQEECRLSIEEEFPIFVQSVLVVASCLGFPLISKYALVPFLSKQYGAGMISPIEAGDIYIVFTMFAILLFISLSVKLIYKRLKRKTVISYMAGENVGNNEEFYSAFGEKQKVEMRNWYMQAYFDAGKLTTVSQGISIIVLCMGIIFTAGGGLTKEWGFIYALLSRQ